MDLVSGVLLVILVSFVCFFLYVLRRTDQDHDRALRSRERTHKADRERLQDRLDAALREKAVNEEAARATIEAQQVRIEQLERKTELMQNMAEVAAERRRQLPPNSFY